MPGFRGLSQVKKLRFRPIQEKQKSRGVTTASLDFLVSIAQAVHNLLILCDSHFIFFEIMKTKILTTYRNYDIL